ncbi:hypothetical protein CUJ91_18250 [Paraburkholderia graminis]|nr:hypothetical protein CUJ91_18250 [Paraburkholderia graminis]
MVPTLYPEHPAAGPRDSDIVVVLDSYPLPASGATEPFVVGNEGQVALAYRVAPVDVERFGLPADNNEPFCVLLFQRAAFHRLGPPNDEGLGRHPLAAAGLQWYSIHEVLNSSFMRNHWKLVSPHHLGRHFVLTFQDSTFECVAADCVMAGVYGSGSIAAREACGHFC